MILILVVIFVMFMVSFIVVSLFLIIWMVVCSIKIVFVIVMGFGNVLDLRLWICVICLFLEVVISVMLMGIRWWVGYILV